MDKYFEMFLLAVIMYILVIIRTFFTYKNYNKALKAVHDKIKYDSNFKYDYNILYDKSIYFISFWKFGYKSYIKGKIKNEFK